MYTSRYLFGFSELVSRKKYFQWGISLMILKYAIDCFSLYMTQKHILTPLEFLNPILSDRQQLYAPGGGNIWPLIISYFISLLMLWIGLSMTVRRAIDAGKAPWTALLFFIPYLNLILMLVLCVLPSVAREEKIIEKNLQFASDSAQRMILSIILFAAFGTFAVVAIVFGAQSYGGVLFAGTPFAVGMALGYYINRNGLLSVKQTINITAITLSLWAFLILLFAIEGLVCLFMAAPIVLLMGILGAMLGRKFSATYFKPTKLSVISLIPSLVILSLVENQISPVLMGEVKSSIIVNADVSSVWKNVVEFPKLNPPTELMFKAGISYPIRARIEGKGVGAIRYCEFNSGAFVEPITTWEENKRLAFDVAFQPRPMTELSLWENIEAPHIDGFFRSKRGEFRLISLGKNQTRLEGSTWYNLDIFPSPYWQVYAEWIVHNIHLRVLNHIKVNAEKT